MTFRNYVDAISGSGRLLSEMNHLDREIRVSCCIDGSLNVPRAMAHAELGIASPRIFVRVAGDGVTSIKRISGFYVRKVQDFVQ